MEAELSRVGSAEEEALECCGGFGEVGRMGEGFLGRGDVVIKSGGTRYQVI